MLFREGLLGLTIHQHNLGAVVQGILNENPQGRMTLDEIVEVLAKRFPYYRADPPASRVRRTHQYATWLICLVSSPRFASV